MSPNQPNKKTNFDYLRTYTAFLPKDLQEEYKEFLEAAEGQFQEIEKEAKRAESMESEIENLKDELSTVESERDNLQNEVRELEEEKEYSDRIDTKLGPQGEIQWSVDNISCKSMMEELDNAIHRGIPILKIENVLRAI